MKNWILGVAAAAGAMGFGCGGAEGDGGGSPNGEVAGELQRDDAGKNGDGKKDDDRKDRKNRIDFDLKECAEPEYGAKTCFEISGADLKYGFLDFASCPVSDFRVFVKADGARDFEEVYVRTDGQACKEELGMPYKFEIPKKEDDERGGKKDDGKKHDRREKALVCVEFYDYVPESGDMKVGAKAGNECKAEKLDCDECDGRKERKDRKDRKGDRYDHDHGRCDKRDCPDHDRRDKKHDRRHHDHDRCDKRDCRDHDHDHDRWGKKRGGKKDDRRMCERYDQG